MAVVGSNAFRAVWFDMAISTVWIFTIMSCLFELASKVSRYLSILCLRLTDWSEADDESSHRHTVVSRTLVVFSNLLHTRTHAVLGRTTHVVDLATGKCRPPTDHIVWPVITLLCDEVYWLWGEWRHSDLLLHPFNGLFSTTVWVSRYQKGKTSPDLYEARGDGFLGCSGIICKQCAPRSRQVTTLTLHRSICTGQMLFLPPNQQCRSTEGT